MQETLSVQQMYDKYHAMWPQHSVDSPVRGALCTIAFDLSCILVGHATIEQCITVLERERDADDAGVRYLYHPVIRDLRSMLDKQEVPEFDPNAAMRGHIIEGIDRLTETYPDVRFGGVKYGILHATGYADLCKERDILDAAYLPSSRVIASIIDAALFDYAGPRICGFCGRGPSLGALPIVDGKHQCYECAHPDDEEDEDELPYLDYRPVSDDDPLVRCARCGSGDNDLITAPRGWLCDECSNCDADKEETTLTCDRCGGKFESLLASPKGYLCEHCYYEDEDEETAPEDGHELQCADCRQYFDETYMHCRAERYFCDACNRSADDDLMSTWTCQKCEKIFETPGKYHTFCQECLGKEKEMSNVHPHLERLSDEHNDRLVTDALLRLHQISDWEKKTPETLKELQDNWVLVQQLMPRFIQQFTTAVPAVPVTCQCVLCKE